MQENAGLTPFGNIWLDPDTCLSDFGNLYTDRSRMYDGKFDFYGAVGLQKMMIHECVHAWQHQQGISVFFKGLWLKMDLDFNNEYQYHLAPNKKLKDFNIEAQASLIEDYIFITLYRNSLSDNELAALIREDGYNNRQQLFNGTDFTGAGYTFRPSQFTLMQDVLSEFIANPNNCL